MIYNNTETVRAYEKFLITEAEIDIRAAFSPDIQKAGRNFCYFAASLATKQLARRARKRMKRNANT